MRQNVLGMTLPQLYMKVNGCWTGGHEENLRFTSANINHGPSACEWWGLDSTQSLQLRECIKVDKDFDIYLTETLWWPDEIYCISKGLTVYHTIQKEGDLILVGPGTIHWVKSCGVTTNTAWNFGPKSFNNFKTSFERNGINKGIDFKSLVPMHVLSLDLVNNELATLDFALVEFLKLQIESQANEEKNNFLLSEIKKVQVNPYDNVINCETCYAELFMYYYKCEKCAKNRIKGKKDFCFFCFDCVNMHKERCNGIIVAVKKFDEESLQALYENIEKRSKGEEFEGTVTELKYPYDRDEEENVYVCPFNGVTDEEFFLALTQAFNNNFNFGCIKEEFIETDNRIVEANLEEIFKVTECQSSTWLQTAQEVLEKKDEVLEILKVNNQVLEINDQVMEINNQILEINDQVLEINDQVLEKAEKILEKNEKKRKKLKKFENLKKFEKPEKLKTPEKPEKNLKKPEKNLKKPEKNLKKPEKTLKKPETKEKSIPIEKNITNEKFASFTAKRGTSYEYKKKIPISKILQEIKVKKEEIELQENEKNEFKTINVLELVADMKENDQKLESKPQKTETPLKKLTKNHPSLQNSNKDLHSFKEIGKNLSPASKTFTEASSDLKNEKKSLIQDIIAPLQPWEKIPFKRSAEMYLPVIHQIPLKLAKLE